MKKSDPRSMAGRPTEKSRQLGQVITPVPIATHMVRCLLSNCQNKTAKILDPCVGPYTFPLAMVKSGLLSSDQTITVVDVDHEMVAATNEWGTDQGINLQSIGADYLELLVDNEYDYAILNPPYVRQEWLDNKLHYQKLFKSRYGLSIPGTSNLYVYFLVKIIMDLRPHGQFVCIVYDSWQSTQYGRWLLAFLEASCESLQIETVSEQPFHDRLIDATIIHGTKKAIMSYDPGAFKAFQSASTHGPLSDVQGFCPLQDVFSTRRGLRLKQADFFLSDISTALGATPFVKKVGRLKGYCIPDDHPEAALLITSKRENARALSELQRRIELAKKKPHENVAILTWFQERPESWFLHREAPYAPILFNYYLRNRPRHIFNPDRRYADNFYGLLPLDDISSFAYLAVLNSTAVCTEIMAHARNQGNSLAKIQLFEYRRICVPDLRVCSEAERTSFHALGLDLVERPHLSSTTLERVDALIASVFTDERLNTSQIAELFKRVDMRARRPKETEACLG